MGDFFLAIPLLHADDMSDARGAVPPPITAILRFAACR